MMAIVSLVMWSRLGPILLSAPTDVAAGKFADQVDRMIEKTCDQLNKGRGLENRARRQLVVRGYDARQEERAFFHLLQYPRELAGPIHPWGVTPT